MPVLLLLTLIELHFHCADIGRQTLFHGGTENGVGKVVFKVKRPKEAFSMSGPEGRQHCRLSIWMVKTNTEPVITK